MLTIIFRPNCTKRVEKDVKTICEALGYDLNTVEFAIKDGVPYAIDFMNPAPDAELASVGEYNHNWIVNEMTDFILKKLEEGFETPEYRWSSMLNPAPKKKPASKAKTTKAKTTKAKTTKAKTTKPKTTKAKKSSNDNKSKTASSAE